MASVLLSLGSEDIGRASTDVLVSALISWLRQYLVRLGRVSC